MKYIQRPYTCSYTFKSSAKTLTSSQKAEIYIHILSQGGSNSTMSTKEFLKTPQNTRGLREDSSLS